MSTWANLIDQVFNQLGVTRPGESVSSPIQAAAFLSAQQRWALNCAEQSFTTAWYHQAFGLTGGVSAYTVGTGGSLTATANPIRITAWRSISGGFESAGDVISFEALEAQAQNTHAETSVLVKAMAADGAYPNKNIRVFPPPSGSGTLILDYYGLMTQPSAVSDAVNFGPGYENFIVNDLAMELYPQYARQGAVSLQAIAANRQNALGVITALNARILGLQQAAPQPAAA